MLNDSRPSTAFIPPAFGDMLTLFVLGKLLDFVSRVPKHTVKDSATGILAVAVTLVCQLDHPLGQQDGLFDVVVT